MQALDDVEDKEKELEEAEHAEAELTAQVRDKERQVHPLTYAHVCSRMLT
jgi:hypothetical protein